MLKNKKTLIFLNFLLLSCYFAFPNSRIFDEAQILEPVHEEVLNRIIYEWETKTGHQMAIVTIQDLNDKTIEDEAVNRFEKIGIGSKANDDGLLFIIAPNDRQLRIEVGYGLESYLNDGLVGQIRDTYIIPHFQTGDYAKGILTGTQALIYYQAEKEGIILSSIKEGVLPATPQNKAPNEQEKIIAFFFFFIMALILIKSKTARNILFWSLLASSVGGRRGGSGMGGFGGGFGGFGGGMSGGGGASGRW